MELPEEAKNYFMYEDYGRDAAINDGGRFTEEGYIYNNRNTFTQWYDGRDVPEEYRVTPQAQAQEKEQADLDAAMAVQAAPETEPRPVIPLIPDLLRRAISTTTATPLHSGMTGGTCRRNTG